MLKNCKYKISFGKKLWLCFTFCEKTMSMILVLWKNNEYDFGFVKKRRLWFLKTVIFPLKPMQFYPPKMRKKNEYVFGFVKKQRVWFWFCEKTTVWFMFCEKTTSIILTMRKNRKYNFVQMQKSTSMINQFLHLL